MKHPVGWPLLPGAQYGRRCMLLMLLLLLPLHWVFGRAEGGGCKQTRSRESKIEREREGEREGERERERERE
jgi:hypothetical protein